MQDIIKVGQLVCSTAGRDKDQPYVVVGLPARNRLLLADGKARKLKNAKIKNIKHLTRLPFFATEVASLLKNKRLKDEIIAGIIDDYLQPSPVKCLMGENKGGYSS